MYNKTLSARNRGTRKGPVKFIVLHDTAGSGTSGDAHYLAEDPERRGVSVDFVVLKDGTVYQLNNDLRGHCTYHAGRHTFFRGESNGNVNQHSIGIEISQKANMRGLDPPYPPEQVDAVAQVCVDLCKQFTLTKNDITTHARIITDGSRSDPRLFPWDEFWGLFNRYMGEHDDVPESASDQTIYKVVAGDNLWQIANHFGTTIEAIKGLNNMNGPSNTIGVGQELIIRQ